MYVQLHEQPQFRRTYGHCVAYSGDSVERPLEIGAVFKFATIGTFVIVKQQLAAAVRAAMGPEAEGQSVFTTDKRQCVRPLVEVGELAEDAGANLKGTSVYLLDLNRNKLYTRNKSDIPQKEKDLSFIFRAMDKSKMD